MHALTSAPRYTVLILITVVCLWFGSAPVEASPQR